MNITSDTQLCCCFSPLARLGIDGRRNHVFIKADKILYFIGRLHICPFISGCSHVNWRFLTVPDMCQKMSTVWLRFSASLFVLIWCCHIYICILFFAVSDNREHETNTPSLAYLSLAACSITSLYCGLFILTWAFSLRAQSCPRLSVSTGSFYTNLHLLTD